MEQMALRDLWMVGGIILGFEVNVLAYRVRQQADAARRGGPGAADASSPADAGVAGAQPHGAMSVADFLGVIAVTVLSFGVFVLPVLGFGSLGLVRKAVALAIIFFFGHIVSLVGHYELYTPSPRSFRYFPGQERICVGFVVLVALAFVVGTAID